MRFPVKRKVVHVFKIMDTENFIDGDGTLQMDSVVAHCVLLFLTYRVFETIILYSLQEIKEKDGK